MSIKIDWSELIALREEQKKLNEDFLKSLKSVKARLAKLEKKLKNEE